EDSHMFEKQFLTLSVATLASFSLSPVFAQTVADDSQTSDVKPVQSTETDVKVGPGKRGKLGKRGMHGFERIRNISSLSDEQKQKIDGVVTAYREGIQPLKQKAKALRQQIESAGADDKASAAAQADLDELKPQIKDKTKAAWQQVKQILTAQ